jgi:hypothetical protein
VTLRWAPGTPSVDSYVIEVGSFRGGSDLVVFHTQSAATSLVVHDVPPRHYYVRVRASIGAETSAPSPEVHVVVAGGRCFETLFAPNRWAAFGRWSSVTLAWEPPNRGCPPTGYIVEVGSRSEATDLALYRIGSETTTLEATNVPPGTYYVRIRSANDVAESTTAEEQIVVVDGGPCVYAIGPSSVFFSRGGSAVVNSFRIQTDPACAWAVSSETLWMRPPSGIFWPSSGAGTGSLLVSVNVNVGAPRTAVLQVRWAGGGADVCVIQDGFGF